MPSKTISIEGNDRFYFLTFTVVHWYYIFDRYDRWDILTNSLNYCVDHKNLNISAYVFMLNHIHLIVQSPDVAGFVRDFKKYTACMLFKNIQKNEPNIVALFMTDNGKFSIWQKTNMPLYLESDTMFGQKWDYIEGNPVCKKYVFSPEHWWYSSANPQGPVKLRRGF